MSSIKEHIETNYPPQIIDHFVSWLSDHGYSYEEMFKSSLKTQNYYFQRFLKECPPDQKQLKLEL